jgi:hypothetical protein
VTFRTYTPTAIATATTTNFDRIAQPAIARLAPEG